MKNKIGQKRAVVVAHLVEQSLPTPQAHGSNSVIGAKFILNNFYFQLCEKTKIMKKRPGMAYLKRAPNVLASRVENQSFDTNRLK